MLRAFFPQGNIMNIKKLLKKYPFLEYRNVFHNETIYDAEEEKVKHNYWTAWDNHGWEKLWKKFLSVIFEEYDKMTEDEKKNFRILDTKEKYGTLRVDISFGNQAIIEAETILYMLSQWVCCSCGKMPKNSRGNRIIWQTKGWIAPYCKDCIKKTIGKNDSWYKINRKIRDLKLMCHDFETKGYDKEGKYIRKYNDLGDWLKLDKIIKIGEQ